MEENEYLIDYYSSYDEDIRLTSKHGQVEYITTMKYINDYIEKGSTVLEVGAGTGRYSIALSRVGYKVTAIELVPHNIEVFKSKLTDEDDVVVEQGNALDLSRYEDNTFDAVLLFGPMYHLYKKEDKIQALNEAKRVVKDTGKIFVAYCMNEAPMIQFAFKEDGNNILEIIKENEMTKDFKLLAEPCDIFELVRIEEINELNDVCGLNRSKIIGTDMFTDYIKERIDSWSDEIYELYLNYHLTICERMDVIGLSNHTLDILTK